MSTDNQNEVVVNNEFEKRIAEAFEIFDHTGSKTIDVREVSSVLCSLGCVPTKAELQEIIQNIQEPENPGSVHLSKFLPYISNLISKYKFHPASAEELLRAFQILDKENNGYITRELITEIMTTRGECFTPEELQEMINTASDPYTGLIIYEYYINQIMID